MIIGAWFLCLIFLSNQVLAGDTTSPANHHISIGFVGYQNLGKEYFFQLHFSGLPREKQPSLKKKGDPIGFGNYIIGDFHQISEPGPNPNGTHIHVAPNEPTLEIVKPDTGSKVILIFCRAVDVPE